MLFVVTVCTLPIGPRGVLLAIEIETTRPSWGVGGAVACGHSGRVPVVGSFY